MKIRLLTSLAAVLVCLTALGCSDSSRRSGSSSGVSSATSSTAPVATGVVGDLTGDPDGEVDTDLQAIVAQAIALEETDDPLDF
jgi:type IV secretory pathway TrbL component